MRKMPKVKDILIGLMWNPLLLIALTLLRGFLPAGDLVSFLQLIPVMFGGLFLYIAVRFIYDLGYNYTSIILFIVFAPITCLFSLMGGLFGPIGIILYCLVASIPAWLVWLTLKFWLAREERRKNIL